MPAVVPIKFRPRLPFSWARAEAIPPPPSLHGQSGHKPADPPCLTQQSDLNMTQRLDARWRSEVTEALCTVQAQFGVAPQSLPRDAFIAAMTDAIWAQREAYARVRQTLVVSPELADESM
jgi:hypothetical protein